MLVVNEEFESVKRDYISAVSDVKLARIDMTEAIAKSKKYSEFEFKRYISEFLWSRV